MGSLQSELIDKGFSGARIAEVVKVDVQVKDKLNKPLSDRELRELMGTNRGTHRRVKGRVKQR